MFQGGDSVLDAAHRPSVVAFAEVENEVAELELLGGFKGALEFVHGIDAAGLVGVQKIDGGSAGAAHFTVREERRMHGKGFKRVGAEPIGELGAMFAAGVVEVLAGGKDLHSFRAGAGSQFEQAWVQALFEEQVSGQDSQHGQGLSPVDLESKSNTTPIVSFSQQSRTNRACGWGCGERGQ